VHGELDIPFLLGLSIFLNMDLRPCIENLLFLEGEEGEEDAPSKLSSASVAMPCTPITSYALLSSIEMTYRDRLLTQIDRSLPTYIAHVFTVRPVGPYGPYLLSRRGPLDSAASR
jgi:hypothetical protein